MKTFHAKKWLNEEFKRHNMYLVQMGGVQEVVWVLMLQTDASLMSIVVFELMGDEWAAITQSFSRHYTYDQLRLICSTVDELNRQTDMEMDV